MSPKGANTQFWAVLFLFSCLITGKTVAGDIDSDKEVLLKLKTYILQQNTERKDLFTDWNSEDKSPCKWPGISCNTRGNHVTAMDLSNKNIVGSLFYNFSKLPELKYLNLSENLIYGRIPDDLSRCRNLRALNLSNNMFTGKFNFTRFNNLEVVDLSNNRIQGNIQFMFPAKACRNLVVLMLSSNNLSGSVDNLFNTCRNLHSLDLRANNLSGNLSIQLDSLVELLMSGNRLGGAIPSWVFSENCSLRALDLSDNLFEGQLPKEISNCKDLVTLNLSGNKFSGRIPPQVGSLLSLESLLLSDNNFSRDVPESLAGMINLSLLDLSRNGFGGKIQEVFGRLHQVKYLFLSENLYTEGFFTSGIHKLRSISELDLSDNNFSGPLPMEISQMLNLKMLFLANNHFTGNIPHEYGNLSGLQVLDLSFNKLTGSIPLSFGKLSSILWLMLANNSLTGEIPAELGNCSNLLWLNLANNQMSGTIPPDLFNIGSNSMAQLLQMNETDQSVSGFSQWRILQRWIPTTGSPLASITFFATGNRLGIIWGLLLKRSIFSRCLSSSSAMNSGIGYIQLRGNKLSGEVPPEISKMQNLGMLYLDDNDLYGELPPEIGSLPLLELNVSRNMFSGEIPREIGMLKCLRSLDLSCNNFSGEVPKSMSNLSELTRFNISYNPYMSGRIPSFGQLATFDRSAFLGNPLLTENDVKTSLPEPRKAEGKQDELLDLFFMAFFASYPIFFILSFLGFLFLGSEKISPLKAKKKLKRRRM